MSVVNRDVRMVPSTAMPSAPPTSRVTSLTAEATPALDMGRDDTMAVDAGAMARPIPAATTIRPIATISPPSSGPSAPPAPANAAQVAMAVGRSAGGNTDVTIDRVAGMTNAAPIPMIVRVAIRTFGSVACEAASAPVPNTASPQSSAPLRPNRSPIAPARRRNPANTRA